MSDFGGETFSAETNKKGNANEESESCCNYNKGCFLFDFFEVKVSPRTTNIEIVCHSLCIVSPSLSKVVSFCNNWMSWCLPARWRPTSKMVRIKQIAYPVLFAHVRAIQPNVFIILIDRLYFKSASTTHRLSKIIYKDF